MATIESSIALTDDMSPQLTRVTKNLEKMASSCDSVKKNAERMEDALGKATTGISSLISSVTTKLAILSAAGLGIYKVFQTLAAFLSGGIGLSDEVAQTTARINLMNDNLQSTARVQEMILASAIETGQRYSDTADFVAKLGLLANNAFSNTRETVAFAEQISKHLQIAGTDSQAAAGSMLQLQQALSMNVLRGQEFNSVLQGMPTVIQAIEKNLGVSRAQLRAMANEGKITGDIIKEAIFTAADETNRKFNEIPITFASVSNMIGSTLQYAFNPIWKALTSISNNGQFKAMLTSITPLINNIATAGAITIVVFRNMVGAIADGMSIAGEILSVLSQGLYVAIPLLIAYGGYWLAVNVPIWANVIATTAATTATAIWTTATQGMTAAMRLLNLTIAFNPIGLLIGLIVLVIAAFVSWQIAAGTLRENVANAFGAIMDIAETAINFIISWINKYIEAVNKASQVFNKVFGTNIQQVDLVGNVSLGNAKAAGQNWIKTFDPIESLKSLLPNDPDSYGESGGGVDVPNSAELETAKNTKGIKDAMDIMEEDLKYLNDIAEREYNQNYQYQTVRVDMSGMQNTITKEADGVDIIRVLKDKIEEEFRYSTEGAYT